MNKAEKFLMELGTGFALMGREVRLEVGIRINTWICSFIIRGAVAGLFLLGGTFVCIAALRGISLIGMGDLDSVYGHA